VWGCRSRAVYGSRLRSRPSKCLLPGLRSLVSHIGYATTATIVSRRPRGFFARPRRVCLPSRVSVCRVILSERVDIPPAPAVHYYLFCCRAGSHFVHCTGRKEEVGTESIRTTSTRRHRAERASV